MADTTTLKLPQRLKARIARLARQTGRAPHAVMLEALERARGTDAAVRARGAGSRRRPVQPPLRELVISFGKTGYLALYRFLPERAEVRILGIRHQRELDYPV